MRSPLLIASIVAVLVLSAALVGPLFVDWQSYRSKIETQLSHFAKRKVTIGSSVSVRLLPMPELRLGDVTIHDPATSTKNPILKAKALNARIALTPLLRGKLRLISFELVKPSIHVEIFPDGSSNLPYLDARAKTQISRLKNITLDAVVIRDGTVHFHDQRNSRAGILHGLNARLSANALSGPAQLDADFIFGKQRHSLQVKMGRLHKDNSDATNVRLRAILETAGQGSGLASRLSYIADGQLSDVLKRPHFSGKLKITGQAMTSLTLSDQKRGSGVRLEANIQTDFTQAEFKQIALILGKGRRATAFRGNAKIIWQKLTRIDVALKTNQIVLDPRALQGQGKQDRLAQEAWHAGKIAKFVKTLSRRLAHFALKGRVQLDAGIIVSAGEQIENAGLTLQFSPGRITVQRMAATFPGHTNFTMTGIFKPLQPKEMFAGALVVRSLDLRKFSNWAAPARKDLIARLDKRSFGNVSFKSAITASGGKINLTGGAFSLGAVTGVLDFTYIIGKRPRLKADLKLDQVDLDKIFVQIKKAEAGKEKTTKAGRSAKQISLFSQIQPHLGKFDMTLKIAAGKMFVRSKEMGSIKADFSLEKGAFVINKFTAHNVAGAKLIASGTLHDVTKTISGRIEARFDAAEFKDLAGLLGGTFGNMADARRLEKWAKRFSPAKLVLNVDIASGRRMSDITLKGKIKGALGMSKFSASGTYASGLKSKGGADINIQAELVTDQSHVLVRQLGIKASPAKKPKRAFIRAALLGRLNSVFELSLGWQAYGTQGTLKGSGRFDQDGTSIETSLKAESDDVRDFLLATGLEMNKGAGDKKIPMRLKGVVAGKGREFVLSGFAGSLGTFAFTLNGIADIGAKRPKIRADVKLSHVSLPWIFNKGLSAKKPVANLPLDPALNPVQTAAETLKSPWAKAPLNIEFFKLLDADITADINRLSLSSATYIEAVKTKFTLVDGLLNFGQFNGRFLDGAFTFNGLINSADNQLSLKANYHLEGGRLEKLLVNHAGDVLAKGRLNLKGALKGQGRSALGFMASLGGNGLLQIRNGVLRGFNPETFQRAIENVRSEKELDAFIKGILIDGEMRISAIDSEINVHNGLVRMENMSLSGPGATAKVISFIDLPTYRIDSQWHLKLSAYPNAPAVTLVFSGPLNAPERSFNVRSLQQHLVVKKFNKRLRQLERIDRAMTVNAAPKRKKQPPPKPLLLKKRQTPKSKLVTKAAKPVKPKSLKWKNKLPSSLLREGVQPDKKNQKQAAKPIASGPIIKPRTKPPGPKPSSWAPSHVTPAQREARPLQLTPQR